MHIPTRAFARAVAAALVLSGNVSAQPQERIAFTVDVAEDFTTFVMTDVNQGAAGQPVRGAWFLTQGRIFPGNTIQGDGATFDPNQAGSIGTWHCRGTHLVPFDPSNPLWVLTSQLYLLPDSARSIATEGLEGSVPVVRTVAGATGGFKGYLGEQRQRFLGFNATGGVNIRVTFVLRKATN